VRKRKAGKGTIVPHMVIPSSGKKRSMSLMIFGCLTGENLRSNFLQNRRLVRFFHYGAAAAQGV
jgi:hypothetical protein